jgi:hypothetical protein
VFNPDVVELEVKFGSKEDGLEMDLAEFGYNERIRYNERDSDFCSVSM